MTAQPIAASGCLFCGAPVAPAEPRCPAFAQTGVAAHLGCCGCQAWAGWTPPGPAPSPLPAPEVR